jgi:cell division protein FtsB
MATNQKPDQRLFNAPAFNVRSAFRQYGPHLLALAIAILLVHNAFGAHGFLALHHTRAEIKKTELQLQNLNKENLQLEQEVKDLKTDPRLIEKIAREDSQLARPGEIIIRLPANPQPPQSASAKP